MRKRLPPNLRIGVMSRRNLVIAARPSPAATAYIASAMAAPMPTASPAAVP